MFCFLFVLKQQEINLEEMKIMKKGQKIDHDKVLSYFKENPNATLLEAANIFDCSYSTIRNIKLELKIQDQVTHKVDREKVAQYFKENPTTTNFEVAEAMGCCIDTISKIRSELKISAVTHKVDREKVAQYYKENPNATLQEVAKAMGCAMSTVIRIKSELKIATITHKVAREKVTQYYQENPTTTTLETPKVFDCAVSTVDKVKFGENKIMKWDYPPDWIAQIATTFDMLEEKKIFEVGEKAFSEGYDEGYEMGKLTTAIELLKEGAPLSTVVCCTGMSEQQIRKFTIIRREVINHVSNTRPEKST